MEEKDTRLRVQCTCAGACDSHAPSLLRNQRENSSNALGLRLIVTIFVQRIQLEVDVIRDE